MKSIKPHFNDEGLNSNKLTLAKTDTTIADDREISGTINYFFHLYYNQTKSESIQKLITYKHWSIILV